MSQSGSLLGSGGGGGGVIQTITGDVGSITGANVTIFANNATNNAGSTIKFVNSGTVSTFDVTDNNLNTALGKNAGNLTLSGNGLSLFGYGAGAALTTGESDTFIGVGAGEHINTGSRNTIVGTLAGSVLVTGTESDNVIISNLGVTGDNNTIRIGTQGTGPGTQQLCFIAGINGATPSAPATPQVTLCDLVGNLTTITSDTAGYVLTSNGPTATPTFQPSTSSTPVNWSVKLSGNIADVTGDNTDYAILYDTVTFDSASGYDIITGLYTVPSTGVYQINITHFVYGGSVAQTAFLGFLLINGVTNVRLMDANPGPLGLSVGGEFMQSASFLYSATAGDTIGAHVQVGNATKDVGVAGGAESCLFSGFKVA